MSKDAISIKLYDSDITDLLNDWETDILLPRTTPDHLGVFEDLQEQELIYVISQKNYKKAYSLLAKLDHILSPQDAIAACLCALPCTLKLMNALLDHCPPIPEFQFQGVGLTASLLAVAARHDKDKMLDLLLKRGADPNGGPTPLTVKTPLDEAFGSAYCCVKRLLEEPGLKPKLTEDILNVWGALREEEPEYQTLPVHSPSLLWSCQLLYEKLTGKTLSPFERMPIPPELRLGHALRQGNPTLALRICEMRPLTEADKNDVLEHFSQYTRLDLLTCDRSPYFLARQKQTIRFLNRFLALCPDLLEHPVMRHIVATMALEVPEPDEELQGWVARMADGPIQLHQLPFSHQRFDAPWLPTLMNFEKMVIHEEFMPRWEARLGHRLTPSIDRNTEMNWELVPSHSVALILERVSFPGDPPADRLSAVAQQVLQWAPEELLPDLLQPGRLLSTESPHALLDACQALPLTRRSVLLPLIHKEPEYEL